MFFSPRLIYCMYYQISMPLCGGTEHYMKVLGITCGRKNGNSEILLKKAFMAIEEAGIETEYIRLQDVYIKSCTGCETCMVNHIKGNWDFRCVHKKEDDHFFFIESRLREADALIISTPVYNLQPPGILLKLFNKLHASGDYREIVKANPKLGAVISVGGTDWTNFGITYAAMATMEFIGNYDNMVDQMKVDFQPTMSMVVLDDAVMQRAHQLGSNVANALLSGKRRDVYVGPEGACPDCHGVMLEYRDGDLWCPMCETKADFTVEGGKLKVNFSDEARSKSRWAPWGQDLHIENISKGHKKAGMGRDQINERKAVFVEYKQPLELPELSRD